MIGKFASGWMLLMLGTAVPAGAQELAGSMEEFTAAATFETADDGSANRDRGVRQTQTSAFTLLEHGLWQREATDVLISAPSVGLPSSLGAETGSPLRPRASSFARTTWLPWVYAAENRHGLPLGLLDALIWTESRYNSLARSYAGAVGLAQACLDASVKYSHERQTFGEEIGRHQLVKQMLAKMVVGSLTLDVLTASYRMSSDRIRAELGFTPQYPTYRETWKQIAASVPNP